MNQKSSLREVPQLVSWVLTGNTKNSKRAAKHSPATAGRKVVGKQNVAKKKKAKKSRR
jgi:hypothetical protein